MGGGGKVEEKTSTCTGFKPTTSQSARKAQHPEARWGGLTRWDRIDRIGLDMMSGSSGVECTLQAACSQEGGGGGDQANHNQSHDVAILFPTTSCTAAQAASNSHSFPARWLKSGTACPGHDPGTLPVPAVSDPPGCLRPFSSMSVITIDIFQIGVIS